MSNNLVKDTIRLQFYSKGAFRLDAKQREAKVGDLRQPSRVVANLRDWSLHRLILITYF